MRGTSWDSPSEQLASLRALEVGEENLQETRDMLACFRSYVRDNDEDGSVAAYDAERTDSWGLGAYNYTGEEYEAFSKEVLPTEFSTIMDLLQFVCYIFILVVGSLLTYGGYMERPGFTLPWLVVYFLYILLSFVSVISQHLKWIVVADWIFWLEVSVLVVDIYCYFLVWAFRRELLLGRALVFARPWFSHHRLLTPSSSTTSLSSSDTRPHGNSNTLRGPTCVAADLGSPQALGV